jgi:hypothetical protein
MISGDGAPMKIEGDWEDLQKRGFVVVREFLPADVVAAAAAKMTSDEFAASSAVAADVDAIIRKRVEAVFPELEKHAGLHLTHTTPSRMFWNRLHYLHTDDTPYWYFQDFTEYVNFWIPVLKPDPKISGLTVVPRDALAERAPDAAAALMNQGCADFIPRSVAERGQAASDAHFLDEKAMSIIADPNVPQTLMIEKNGERRPIFCDVDIRSLGVSPETAAGDAVIVRGDVLHQTQDRKTERLAISTRALNGERKIRRRFVDELSVVSRHGLLKAKMAAGNIFGVFTHHSAEELPAKTLIAFMDAVAAGREPELSTVKAIRPRLEELLRISAST